MVWLYDEEWDEVLVSDIECSGLIVVFMVDLVDVCFFIVFFFIYNGNLFVFEVIKVSVILECIWRVIFDNVYVLVNGDCFSGFVVLDIWIDWLLYWVVDENWCWLLCFVY